MQWGDPEAIASLDSNASEKGQDLVQFVGLGCPARIKVRVDAKVALGKSSGGIGLHRIRRDLGDVQPQPGSTLEAGWEVISTCQELSHAYAQRPRL